jgi:hypothetical protein
MYRTWKIFHRTNGLFLLCMFTTFVMPLSGIYSVPRQDRTTPRARPLVSVCIGCLDDIVSLLPQGNLPLAILLKLLLCVHCMFYDLRRSQSVLTHSQYTFFSHDGFGLQVLRSSDRHIGIPSLQNSIHFLSQNSCQTFPYASFT